VAPFQLTYSCCVDDSTETVSQPSDTAKFRPSIIIADRRVGISVLINARVYMIAIKITQQLPSVKEVNLISLWFCYSYADEGHRFVRIFVVQCLQLIQVSLACSVPESSASSKCSWYPPFPTPCFSVDVSGMG
jgi:hypothetical protein